MRRPADIHRNEDGMALAAAIVLMVVAALIIGAVMIASSSVSRRAQDTKERILGNAPVDEGVTAYINSLSSGRIGEQTSFVFTRKELQRQASSNTGWEVLPNSSPLIDPAYRTVDSTYFPTARLTVRHPTEPGSPNWSYWQMFALSPPRYGATKGGVVVAYFRGWLASASGAGATKASYVRAQLRPGNFADFQIMSDGQLSVGAGAELNGRIHSNGFTASIGNQYSSGFMAGKQIYVDPAVQCDPAARITTANGVIDATGVCATKSHPNTNETVNMLRTPELVNRIRSELCPGGSDAADPDYQKVRVYCPTGARDPVDDSNSVRLSGSTICGNGGLGCRSVAVAPASAGRGGTAGTVVVYNHNVHVSGCLNNGRVTIIAGTPRGAGGVSYAGAPSIYIDRYGNSAGSECVGTNGGADDAVGLIADGDVIIDESKACPARVDAAILAVGGAMSLRRPFRTSYAVGGGVLCQQGPPAFSIDGSIVGHYAPMMIAAASNDGYGTRRYAYDPNLYNNPPPMYPTVGRWMVQHYSEADLSCFNASGNLITSRAGCA